jgi:hypothetical protein
MLYKLRAIIIKIEKRFKISLFFIFPLRFILVCFEKFFLQKSTEISNLSNYKLDFEKLKNKDLNVISAGVGTDISFENEIIDKFSVKKIVLIDPSTESQNIASSKKLTFEKAALFTKMEEKKIFKVLGDKNLSLENLFGSKHFDLINTITVDYVMKKHSYTKLDILKLDVEGVADKIIDNCLSNYILPDQICFELERPLRLSKQFNYFRRFINIIFLLKKYNYKLYNCTNLKLGLRSEILAVRHENK